MQVEDFTSLDLGETRVHALRGCERRTIQARRVPGDHGRERQREIDVMNILGCLDRPTAGTLLLEGMTSGKHNKKELAHIRNRKIGFVFQGSICWRARPRWRT